ncbi:hypothetical protein IE81DRAFT_350809 [Ceraceosorus guamensis]|uniref:Uncharacterized protein n=1 Tax=Ceraceosorus guamensis TaxID=1522189 RepID=A0A316VQK8_9BASI|nr:hypothetical protein IE81DRAFT_350809 [Ceraceosorus guamensis]PWN38713.1 hypothetical protein IE81DRAFT_350809 [Ceraceosorus guamensis]
MSNPFLIPAPAVAQYPVAELSHGYSTRYFPVPHRLLSAMSIPLLTPAPVQNLDSALGAATLAQKRHAHNEERIATLHMVSDELTQRLTQRPVIPERSPELSHGYPTRYFPVQHQLPSAMSAPLLTPAPLAAQNLDAALRAATLAQRRHARNEECIAALHMISDKLTQQFTQRPVIPERLPEQLAEMRQDLLDLAAYEFAREGMRTIKVGHRMGVWLDDAAILPALHALAKNANQFNPSEWPCFLLNGPGQHYVCRASAVTTLQGLAQHGQQYLRNLDWCLLQQSVLESTEETAAHATYVGCCHRDLLGPSAAQTRAAEDSGQVGGTRRNRWDSGGWQSYGLSDGFVLRLFDGAGVQDGRPAAVGEVNAGIVNLIRQNHAHLCRVDCSTPDAPAALQRIIDMASRTSVKRPSMIVMKDMTAEDLRGQHTADYGLFGLGCGQGPASFQQLLALIEYSHDKTVYDRIDRRTATPAYARRHVIDFWSHGPDHRLIFLHAVMLSARLLVAFDAPVVRFTSTSVIWIMCNCINKILRNVAQEVGPHLLADVLTGVRSIADLGTAIFDRGDASNLRWQREAGQAQRFMVDLCGTTRSSSITLRSGKEMLVDYNFLAILTAHEDVLKYLPNYAKDWSSLMYLSNAVFRAAQELQDRQLLEGLVRESGVAALISQTRSCLKKLFLVQGFVFWRAQDEDTEDRDDSNNHPDAPDDEHHAHHVDDLNNPDDGNDDGNDNSDDDDNSNDPYHYQGHNGHDGHDGHDSHDGHDGHNGHTPSAQLASSKGKRRAIDEADSSRTRRKRNASLPLEVLRKDALLPSEVLRKNASSSSQVLKQLKTPTSTTACHPPRSELWHKRMKQRTFRTAAGLPQSKERKKQWADAAIGGAAQKRVVIIAGAEAVEGANVHHGLPPALLRAVAQTDEAEDLLHCFWTAPEQGEEEAVGG